MEKIKVKISFKIAILILLMCCLLVYLFNYYLQSKDKIANNDILNNEQLVPWGINKIISPFLRSKFTGKGVKIAILDSGVNFKHPDFSSNIKNGYNVITPKALPIDDCGHGTLVIGVIAAQDNKFGVVGIAPNAAIYPVKVLDQDGEGNIDDVIKGIDWCIDNNIQIINMSFAIKEDSPDLHNAIVKALHAGIIIVASANNSFGGVVGYPASYEEVISVTAIDKKLSIAKSSPQGKIDFSAPGVNIITTSNNCYYKECEGTSFATPYVSGIISLILENPKEFGLVKKNKYQYSEIYDALKKMSRHLGDSGKNSTFGDGFVSMK